MKQTLIIILFFFSSCSCMVRTGYYSNYNTTYIFTPTIDLYRPTTTFYTWGPSWGFRQRYFTPNSVFNSNYHYHNYINPRIRTNLPLQNGPIGGRRK